MIYTSWKYNTRFAGNNLYIAYRNPDSSWRMPKNLGENVNTDELDVYPYITPDGKYFLFTRRSISPAQSYSKIYWASTRLFDVMNNSSDPGCSPITLTPSELNTYAGTYSNTHFAIEIIVSKDASAFIAKTAGRSEFYIEATGKEEFRAVGIIFNYNKAGKELAIKHGTQEFIFKKTK